MSSSGEMLDADDKESKAQRSQAQRLKHSLICFAVLLLVAAFASRQSYSYLPGHMSSSNHVAVAVDTGPTEDELQHQVDQKDKQVRGHKRQPNMIMETDPHAMKVTKELQHLTHHLLVKRYGRHTFRIKVDLDFPAIVTEKDGKPARDSFFIELGPIDLIPCSVYYFLELVRSFESGTFMRNANHVLQSNLVTKGGRRPPMPFQEYSPEFPHAKYTTGYAGRPSGPQWYVSIMDNTRNHGPGSQQKHNPYEADALFGRLVLTPETKAVVERIHSTPQKEWLDEAHKISIVGMTILIQDGKEWSPWKPKAKQGGLSAETDKTIATE